MRAVIPVTNRETVQMLIDHPGLVRPGDWLTISTGGVDRVADPTKIRELAELLGAAHPHASIYAFTSGFANVERLAASVGPPVVGIFYDYEPNFPNEPEFSFDPSAALASIARATETTRARGLRLVAYLTGQALLNPAHEWDYARFRGVADEICVQTQAALRRGAWKDAIDRIQRDFGTALPHVQVTVCPGLPNTVDVPQARAAWGDLDSRGFPGCVVWWVPRGFTELGLSLEARVGTRHP